MRILGIDYGDTRTGISISDSLCFLAGESLVIKEYSRDVLVDKIIEIINQNDIGEIVLGFPKNMNATLGPRAEKSMELKAILEEKTGLKVVLWDERQTTVAAHKILSMNGKKTKKHKASVDAVAASLILQSYLDFKS